MFVGAAVSENMRVEPEQGECPDQLHICNNHIQDDFLDDEIFEGEVFCAIKRLKQNKSPWVRWIASRAIQSIK